MWKSQMSKIDIGNNDYKYKQTAEKLNLFDFCNPSGWSHCFPYQICKSEIPIVLLFNVCWVSHWTLIMRIWGFSAKIHLRTHFGLVVGTVVGFSYYLRFPAFAYPC